MRFLTLSLLFLVTLFLCSLLAGKLSAETLQEGTSIGSPELLYSHAFSSLVAGPVVRYGDLDGDHRSDILVAQNRGQKIVALTALTLEGVQLWQVGNPQVTDGVASTDLAVQIYDINQDGANEVIVVRNKKLQILRGRDGKVLRQTQVPIQARDAILIGRFGSKGQPGILLKDRMREFRMYTAGLKLRWKREEKTGHFPMEYDFDGDGKDELQIGFSLYNSRGKRKWTRRNLGPHNDAVDIDDVDGDGLPEIAIASSKRSYLLDQNGQTLWVKDHRHSQHTVIGNFDWSTPFEKEIVFVERPKGNVHCFNASGELLWTLPELGKITMVSSVDGWTGNAGESLLLLFRLGNQYPVLMNGSGQIVATFPFPLAGAPETGLDKHFVQHFDLEGDGREEILINSRQGFSIYRNAAEAPAAITVNEGLPSSRVYNASFYTGRQ